MKSCRTKLKYGSYASYRPPFSAGREGLIWFAYVITRLTRAGEDLPNREAIPTYLHWIGKLHDT